MKKYLGFLGGVIIGILVNVLFQAILPILVVYLFQESSNSSQPNYVVELTSDWRFNIFYIFSWWVSIFAAAYTVVFWTNRGNYYASTLAGLCLLAMVVFDSDMRSGNLSIWMITIFTGFTAIILATFIFKRIWGGRTRGI